MKKLISKIFLLTPIALTLTSCGLDLDEVYKNDAYNSPVFVENYYRIYPKQIAPKTEKGNPFDKANLNDNIKVVTPYELNANQFTVGYENAYYYDMDIKDYEWTDSSGALRHGMLYQHYSTPGRPTDVPYYGEKKKANLIDDQFKQGYLSKLYDGWMFCGGKFELSRVQMDERGFGQIFDKEMIRSGYMALQFKAAFRDQYEPAEGESYVNYQCMGLYTKIKLNVNFYERDGNNYNVKRVSMPLDHVPTHIHGAPSDEYIFVAFTMDSLNLSRCCGYSIDYEFDRADWIAKEPGITEKQIKNTNYALMLYEVFMPDSTWR